MVYSGKQHFVYTHKQTRVTGIGMTLFELLKLMSPCRDNDDAHDEISLNIIYKYIRVLDNFKIRKKNEYTLYILVFVYTLYEICIHI